MKYRKVGRIDEKFSVIGYGCWPLSGKGAWDNYTDKDAIGSVKKAIELGVNYFDVAPVYGLGHAEIILGKSIKGVDREKILIGSKCGLVWDDNNNVKNDLTEKSLMKEIDDTLRRLQTEYIDIYQIHWPDPNTPIGETMEALMKIKNIGKVKHIGVCNFSVDSTKEAMKYGEIDSQQNLYNMIDRNSDHYHFVPLDYRTEDEVLPFCRENEQAFFPYSPLLQGLLTGRFKETGNFSKNDVRKDNPQLKGDKLIRNLNIVNELQKLAKEIGKPMNELALNWLIKNDAVTSIIAGASNAKQVEENIKATEWELTDDMMERINKILEIKN